jgi:glycosyltransferase involved in cell wall biosynthesis
VNVLLLVPTLSGGGAERVAANLANHWARIGWTVSLATMAPAEFDVYRLDPKVRRVHLGHYAPSPTPLHSAWASLARVRALRRVLREQRPDVAVSLMAPANLLMALGAPRGASLRAAVGAEHTHPPLDPMSPVKERLRRLLYPRLDAVVALTGDSAQWLRENVRVGRIDVIPNPVAWPLADLEPRVEPQALLPPDRRLLLGVGRLHPVKGFDLVVDAFAAIASRHRDWTLAIVGEGEEHEALGARVRAHGLADRVLLPGRIGNVAAWYRRADLFVSASHVEGFPNVIVEALAHELPVVAVDCDTGPRDIVRDGVDGLLVPPGEPAALRDALDVLMGDATRRTAMALRAAEARERFSMDRVTQRWAALFEELIGARRGR